MAMTQGAKSAPHDVIADINYFPATGKPIEPAEWNARWKPRSLTDKDEFTRPMRIRDIRSADQRFQLHKNGFEFVRLPQKDRKTDDDGTIKREYYPEIEELVKKMTGASVVYAFNHAIRQTSDPSETGKPDQSDRPRIGPTSHPHVDYAATVRNDRSGILELMEGTKKELTFPPHIAKLYDTCSRFCFINVWRPLKTVKREPLAVADATTVPDSDYQVRLREFPSGNKSVNYVISHGSAEEQHKWYYMSEMEPNEAVVFEGYDTKQDEPGWRCPHAAFTLPDTEALPPRESIEMRLVCFWD